jgi:hypothetical protein
MDELFIEKTIIPYLDSKQLYNFSQTSKYFRNICTRILASNPIAERYASKLYHLHRMHMYLPKRIRKQIPERQKLPYSIK